MSLLSRYGRRRRGQKEGAEPASNLLPLMDHEEDKAECDRRRGRGLRLAARCQVSGRGLSAVRTADKPSPVCVVRW